MISGRVDMFPPDFGSRNATTRVRKRDDDDDDDEIAYFNVR